MRVALMIEGQEGVSWADWLALAPGVRGARRRGPLPLRPLPLADRSGACGARRLDRASGARRPHDADRAGHAGLAGDLPAGRGARERRDHRVRDLGRADLARDGHRLDGGRARGVRLPVPADEGTARDLHRADRGRARLLGRTAAAAPDRRRQRPLRDRRPGRPVGRRVQHGHGDARGVRRAAREAEPRVRTRGPRADPALADDRLRDRPRRGGSTRADPPPARARRPDDRSRRVPGAARRGRRSSARSRRPRSACARTRRRESSA